MTSAKTASASLWRRLIVGLVAVSIIAVTAAGAGLYVRFKKTNSQFRDQTLLNQAQLIKRFLESNPSAPVRLPAYINKQFSSGTGKYAIVDNKGTLLAASTGVSAPLSPVDPNQHNHYFILEQNEKAANYYGLSVKSEYAGQPAWVQVAFIAGDIVFDSVLEEFMTDIAWIWIPFVIILLLVNLFVARIGLEPLNNAAREAAAIGPSTLSIRLTEKGLPRDIYTLVTAVNQVLDRLEQTLDAQRAFITDAAHELRTPVSVLKAHAAILPDVDGLGALVEEINGLERLVNQLLDSARLDMIEVKPNQTADLNEVAQNVAAQLAPMAINAGRSVEVIASPAPVLIHGAKEYLSQALRNIVENAIKHTPEGTTVSIRVTSPGSISVIDHGSGVRIEHRETIFKRFWRAGDAHSGGAGLGLDIAARTAAAHGGTISVDDAPDGGAVFTIRFPA